MDRASGIASSAGQASQCSARLGQFWNANCIEFFSCWMTEKANIAVYLLCAGVTMMFYIGHLLAAKQDSHSHFSNSQEELHTLTKVVQFVHSHVIWWRSQYMNLGHPLKMEKRTGYREEEITINWVPMTY